MTILDTNVWLGLLDEDDTLHDQATKVIDDIEGKIIVPYSVITEVANILSGRISKKAADDFLFMVVNDQEIELVDNDLATELFFFASFEERLSFTDYGLISMARDRDCELVTFDKQMQKFIKNPRNRGKVVKVS